MSNAQPHDRDRRRKRDIIQGPFRQGLQWVERQLDELRSRPPSPRSTRPSSPQTAVVTPSSDTLGLPDERLTVPNPVQETSSLSASQAKSIRRLDPKGQDDETTSLSPDSFPPNVHPQEGLGQNPPPNIYSIGMAENVFAGVNYGVVNMIADGDEHILKLRSRLTVSARADHMYYGSSEETTLRRSTCTPGTRVDILHGVTYWAINMSPSGEIVYWLSGQAGAGKTTISNTVARLFEKLFTLGGSRVILGASFFCSRQFLETRSASAIIRTIVYQLAIRSKPFLNALKECGRFETVDHGPRSQLMGLLVEPWRKSAAEREAANEPCYLIPIDALDELEANGGVEFLTTLFDVVEEQDLTGLKFFVTSRSEPALVQKIEAFSNKQVCRLEQVPLEQSSADIRVYLEANLAKCATTEQLNQLVTDSAGLFIHAATVVEYLQGRDAEEQKSLLHRLLSTSPSLSRPSRAATATLDNLYMQILETSLVDPRERDDDEAFQECLLILHTFMCTIERTSTSFAVDILNASGGNSAPLLEPGIANGVLHRLYAVLYTHGGQVMWFHKSFPDFLFDKHRSQKFFCDQARHHRRLAVGCFEIMSKYLRFNIANIPSSHQLDADNPALPASIEANIPRVLRYGCGNWSDHLILACHEMPDPLVEILNNFLQLRILFWMEAMNLLGQRGRCQGMLRAAQVWSQNFMHSADLVGNIADAAAFAAYHSTSKAALSTPHLYLSSLATFPRKCAPVRTWRQQFGGIPGFIHRQGVDEALVVSITVGNVSAMAVSPDGTNVAVGSGDGLARILDLSTGEELRVLKSCGDAVYSVAYSPDGTHVVLGSKGQSVLVWALFIGEILELNGHTGTVRAVAYSPDGSHVVSGSADNSVRVWQLALGKGVRAFLGHSNWVMAVAYSPDGSRIISSSIDLSLRVWDPSTGQEVKVLQPGLDILAALACSPDGSHIVFGSEGGSTRVLDLSTGKEIQCLEGHTDWVRAVAYSPDGTQIASGSDDKTLRVWNLSSGEEKVLKGHSGLIVTVAYSPGGTHLVSGSVDRTVRVWDLSTNKSKDLEDHTDYIDYPEALALSPDRTHLVFSSKAGSIRVLDIPAGKVTKVLEGHSYLVRAVAYSPDATRIVSASVDGSLREWDLSTGEELKAFNVRPPLNGPHYPGLCSGIFPRRNARRLCIR